MPGGPVHIQLLGDFAVSGAGAFPSRRAAELVQLLALAPGRALARERVIEALWPHLAADAGAANLRKAAHHARQALGDSAAVTLRNGRVALLPGREVRTDVEAFEAGGAYGGELLPEAPYETWTQEPRARLRALHLDRLRRAGDWEALALADATDEPANRELMGRALEGGHRAEAIRWYGRLRTALRRELGAAPGPETVALYDRCVAGLAGPDPEFVGRALELARITRLLRDPPAELGLLAIRGPGGIGKSALCRQAERLAVEEGWVAVGVAATETGTPYAPLLALTERFGTDAVGPAARAVLEQLAAGSGELTRHKVIGAVRRLLIAVADDRPVLLVLDDAHLADEATLDAVALLGSLSGPPLLLALAYRPESAPAALTGLVARLARRGSELDLGPLPEEESAALVAAASPVPRGEDTVRRIAALGEGNPFLVLELAGTATVGVPALLPTVRDAIASRFVELGKPLVEALQRLALAGDELEATHAVAAASADEDEADAALDAGLRSGVLVIADGRYRFRHELVRQALADRLPPHRQAAAHRDIASRLAAADAAPALVARHFAAGGRIAEAVPFWREAAARAVRVGAYADALDAIARILDHEPRDPAALRLRAEALDAQGAAEAPAAYAAAAAVADPETAEELTALRALAQIKLGDPQGGLAVLGGTAPTTLRGRIAAALAHAGAAALGFGDPAIGAAQAAEARRLALQSGDPQAVTVASWAQAAAAHANGDLRDSVRADLRDTHMLGALATSTFDGQLCITQRLLYGARPYEDVIAFADSLAAEAQRLGAGRGRAFAVTIRGEAKLLAGRLDEADADLAEGALLHREIGGATGEAFALQRRAEVALHRGDRHRARRLLDEALAIARESDVGFHLFDRIYGTLIAAAPDPDAALAALEEAERAVRGPVETCPGCRITLAVPAAIAAARAGDEQRTREWLQASEYLAGVVMRLPAWDAALQEARGFAEPDAHAAAGLFAAAAEGFAAAGQPLDAGRCAALAATRG